MERSTGGGGATWSGGLERARRAAPETWIPLLAASLDIVDEHLRGRGVAGVVVGAGAYGIHVEFDPTKDVDIALASPLDITSLAGLLEDLGKGLTKRGYRVLGSRIQLGRGSEDWVVQVFTAVTPGVVVGVEVFNLLNARPVTLFDVEEKTLAGRRVRVLTLEAWFASKLSDPRGVDRVNLARLEKAAERVDVQKLLRVLRRIHLWEIIRINAEDVMRRAPSAPLKRVLSYIV